MKWAVAVTTAPRQAPTVEACLSSLAAAGWPEPFVFAEPGSVAIRGAIQHTERLGLWRNWLYASNHCLTETDADVIMTVQDDVVLHPDSRQFAESVLWPAPNAGFLSLYSPKHYQFDTAGRPVKPGVRRVHTGSLWGACCLIWPRSVLSQVVSHPLAKTWLGSLPHRSQPMLRKRVASVRRREPHTIKNSDTAIGQVMNSLGRTMWFATPSPARHVARYSSVGHAGNTGRRNCFNCADHDEPLSLQVPLPGTQFRIDCPDTGEPGYDAGRRRWSKLGYDLSMSVPLDLWTAIRQCVTPESHTLEFGCGVSTTAFEAAARHVAVESDAAQARRFRSAIHCPAEAGWYVLPDDLLSRKYDVILVDGPHRGSRLAGIDDICRMADGVVFVDDVSRDAEQQLAQELARRLDAPLHITARWAKIG